MTPMQKIYWHTTVQMPNDTVLSPLPETVDVAVIGGGFTGLSAARTLAQKGVRVAVLEANTIGWGASSRNGGMVLTGLKLGMQTVLKRYGREIARRLFQCSLDAIDTVEQIIKAENIDCGFARYGHLLTANKAKQYDALEEEAVAHDHRLGEGAQGAPEARRYPRPLRRRRAGRSEDPRQERRPARQEVTASTHGW